jgi:alkylation response protein AidB-like acyl-CoA dehydrogenase
VRDAIEDEEGFSTDLWAKVKSAGWPGILVSEEDGGAGAALTDAAVLFEALGHGLAPVPLHSSAVLATALISRTASEEQRAMLLPRLASGERIGALALTEDRSTWRGENVRTQLTRSQRSITLRGRKSFVADAMAADELVVIAAHDGDLVPVVVEAGQAGVTRARMRGFSGQPLAEITLDSVDVGPDKVLAVGRQAVEEALDIGTALLCVYMAGAARRVYEMTMDYAAARTQFGQPIARFQRVQDRLIEMLNAADAARWTAYEAVWRLEHNKPHARESVSVAKVTASDGFYLACENAHHVHAGVGSDKAYGLYLYTQASRSYFHYLGDPAFHRRRLAGLLRL